MISLLVVTRERAEDRRFGLGKSLKPILEELARQGVEVLYLCQEDAGPRSRAWLRRLHTFLVAVLRWWWPDTQVEALIGGILERLNMGRLAAKLAFQRGVTHVHCHDPIIAAGFQGCRWWYGGRCATRVRHGLTQHGFGSYIQAFHDDGARLGGRAMRRLRRWEARILRRSDWVIMPTVASRDQLARDLAEYPLPKHWHVIPHPRPVLALPTRQAARQQLGWEADWFVVLGVGRNAALKRFEDLIRACAMLHNERLHLVLLGPGEDLSLRQIAQEAGLPNARLHLAVSDDPSAFYAAADVYVSTSATESFGLANLEALMAGLPVIATAVGGVPEVVGSGGWLLPPYQPMVLAQAIERLWSDRWQGLELSRRARSWVARWPDASQVAAAYLALYRGEKVWQTWPSQHQGLNPICQPRQLSLYPLPKPLALSGKLRVLVFAPHPDDETLGVGGTLAGLVSLGAAVRVVVVTDGAQGDPERKFSQPAQLVRQEELRQAMAILGIQDFVQWQEPDGNCQDNEALRARVQAELAAFAPDWLLTPSPMEIHRDHVAVAHAVIAAWRQAGAPCQLYCYEVSQPLPATHIVDVTRWLEAKLKALEAYRLPLSYHDYRSITRSLMRYRAGCLAPAGVEAVEAFMHLTALSCAQLAALRLLREGLE